MSKREIEAEFESKESAEEFKTYLGGELNGRKHLRDTDKKRRPSTVSEPTPNDYRKANGNIEVYVKTHDELEEAVNDALVNKLRSWGYNGEIPHPPLTDSDAAVLEHGAIQLRKYQKQLDMQFKNAGITTKLEEEFGKPAKLVIPVSGMKQDKLDLFYSGLEMYAKDYGKSTFTTPIIQRVLWKTTSGTMELDVSTLDVRKDVKFDGEVYKTGYEVEAGVRGWRGAVKSLYTDAGTKAKELGSTKYEVRKK